MKGQQSAKVIPVCPTGDMNVCKLLLGNPFSHYRATLLFLPQMSTSCCHRRKSPREDRPSHQALSCGDNERLLQSIKGSLRNFRSDQSRWSATTIGLRWAALPHRGLNPRELTKDARGRCAAGTQEVPDSYDGRESPLGAINHACEIHFFVTTFCLFGFTTIKESFKTFARERKGIKQIAAFFFSFNEKLVICKSQTKDEQHQDSLRWPKRGRFSRLDGGWAVEDMLLLGSSWVSFLSFLFSLKTVFRGRKKNNDSSVFNLQVVRKEETMTLKQVPLFSFLSASGCMNAKNNWRRTNRPRATFNYKI